MMPKICPKKHSKPRFWRTFRQRLGNTCWLNVGQMWIFEFFVNNRWVLSTFNGHHSRHYIIFIEKQNHAHDLRIGFDFVPFQYCFALKTGLLNSIFHFRNSKFRISPSKSAKFNVTQRSEFCFDLDAWRCKTHLFFTKNPKINIWSTFRQHLLPKWCLTFVQKPLKTTFLGNM